LKTGTTRLHETKQQYNEKEGGIPMIATRESAITAVRVGRIEKDKVLTWLSLGLPLAVAAVLNMWNLAQNGYSNTYYAVAVRSMIQSFRNFFFVSYDAGGFISVDKPPVALWIQAISAKIFGFSGLSLLLPEALAGVACVALVYFMVRRIFGTLAGFVAALAMALTPIAVAVERGNNTDTWLMFFLLLAAWAMSRATEKGKLVLLVLAMALVGVAFNVKMLAAFIVLPTFYLLYLVAAPLKWYKRVLHLGLSTIVLLAVSFSWIAAVDLTPASQRPWVGGSQVNSALDLALNYNGLGRVTGNEGAGMPGGGPTGGPGGNQGLPQGNFQPPQDGQGFAGGQPPSGGPGQAGGSSGMFGAGVAGPLRLFGSELASQWSWLFPLVIVGALATIVSLKRKLFSDRRGQAVLLWAGWLATYGVVFSMAEGIFHVYYLIILAPAAAALAGIGVAALWRAYRNGGWQAWLLPVGLLVTAAWQVKVLVDYNYPQWGQWLIPATVAASVLAALPLLAGRIFTRHLWRRIAPGMVAVGLLAVLISPLAWSVTPVLAVGNGVMPQAGPSTSGQDRFGGPGGQAGFDNNSGNGGLITYLEANSNGYFYLLAVSSANEASSIALQTGKPVLATGGFTGSDPALTVEKLQQLVATKQVRFVSLGGGGRSDAGSAVSSWIQSTCSAVDTSQYSGSGTNSGFGGGFGGITQLYDCAAN
jgi:4-amino-4-deoxy-L-arabinose transferase-like glycosyltransferase